MVKINQKNREAHNDKPELDLYLFYGAENRRQTFPGVFAAFGKDARRSLNSSTPTVTVSCNLKNKKKGNFNNCVFEISRERRYEIFY